MMAKRQAALDSTHREGSSATPIDPPIASPHISSRFVSLSLSNSDRILVLTEVQRLDAISLVAQSLWIKVE